jgi:histidine phosphotransferase ChpT
MPQSLSDIEFSALMVSRVCHDLVGPLGAVVNGLEVLEDETDATMRADALKLVGMSANQALARIQFMRIAFGAAGSAGAELDLGEIGRLVTGLIEGSKVSLDWHAPQIYWPKDWAKLLMNSTLIGVDCLPRGGVVTVTTNPDPAAPSFKVRAVGMNARALEDVERGVRGDGEAGPVDARGIQPFLTYRLSRNVNAGLTLTVGDGVVELTGG